MEKSASDWKATVPWSWCQRWAGWRVCSCLLGLVWSLCILCPGSWEGGRAGRAGHSPSLGLPQSLYLQDGGRAERSNHRPLLYHIGVLKSATQTISSFKFWKQTKHVPARIHLHPVWFHFLHQSYFISYSCLFFKLAALCSHLLSIIQYSQGFTCCFLSVWFCVAVFF